MFSAQVQLWRPPYGRRWLLNAELYYQTTPVLVSASVCCGMLGLQLPSCFTASGLLALTAEGVPYSGARQRL